MIVKTIFSALIMTAILSACSPRTTELATQTNNTSFIVGQKLRKLLINAHIEQYDPPEINVSHKSFERFDPGGRYQRGLGRIVLHGTFKISHDEFCVEGEDIQRLCRRVYATYNGLYVLAQSNSKSQVVVTINRL